MQITDGMLLICTRTVFIFHDRGDHDRGDHNRYSTVHMLGVGATTIAISRGSWATSATFFSFSQRHYRQGQRVCHTTYTPRDGWLKAALHGLPPRKVMAES